MRRITFDIETEGDFNSNGDFSNLEVTVVGVFDSATNELTSYLKEDLPKLWPLMEQADILVGYNSDHFDIPILNKYYMGDLSKIKSIDLLKEIKAVLGRRLKLDSIAEATLGVKKSGHGLQAVEWWKTGQIQKIIEYCTQDVRVTRDVFQYGRQNGFVKIQRSEDAAANPASQVTVQWN